ncbi:DASH complex subunit Dad3-domain-containing protein [Amylostereum chailletii]|nr:DASH complex subunit Dad3-domain-containing protein [Amylostereum chailletii]
MSTSSIFDVNPYEDHPQLSQSEADVLWEYAKLSQHIKDLLAQTRRLSEAPDEGLLQRLRVLEQKMGLVLTLFKASVWGYLNEQAQANTPYTPMEGDSVMDATVVQ